MPALDVSDSLARIDPSLAQRLLSWYDRHHRELPWRSPPAALRAGRRPDPYAVWLSEIMLQQTTVDAVKPFFRAFLTQWPDIGALARAEPDAVMKAWAGLGYYSRARNLIACAAKVAGELDGRFPADEAALRSLPGIGPYTAAAIAAIAFDQPALVIDGNVERVVARLAAIDAPLPAAKPLLKAALAAFAPARRSGDFAQAMMDLGATICTPRRPACLACPLSADCRALAEGDPALLPVKTPKPERPLRRGAAFVAVRADGAVLLRKRCARGLLAGMSEVPTSDWTARADGDTSTAGAPFAAAWRSAGSVGHVFTHFALELSVYRADLGTDAAAPPGGWWSLPAVLAGEALPTLMKKAIEAAKPGATLKAPDQRGRK